MKWVEIFKSEESSELSSIEFTEDYNSDIISTIMGLELDKKIFQKLPNNIRFISELLAKFPKKECTWKRVQNYNLASIRDFNKIDSFLRNNDLPDFPKEIKISSNCNDNYCWATFWYILKGDKELFLIFEKYLSSIPRSQLSTIEVNYLLAIYSLE